MSVSIQLKTEGAGTMENADNVNVRVNGEKLIIEVDISANSLKNAQLSSTKKSRVVASTHGFGKVHGTPDVKLALNVIIPR
jgi:hypothetical protein